MFFVTNLTGSFTIVKPSYNLISKSHDKPFGSFHRTMFTLPQVRTFKFVVSSIFRHPLSVVIPVN